MQEQGSDEQWLAKLRGQRRWSPSEGRRVLEMCRASGQSKSAFARCHNLQMNRVHYWAVWERDHSRPAAAATLATTLVPVRVRQSKTSEVSGGVAIRVNASGLEVLDLAQVDPTWLAALLGALQAGAR